MMKKFFLISFVLLLIPTTLIHAQLSNEADSIAIENGVLIIHPILHGSVVFEWNGLNIYVDPYGGGGMYKAKGSPDIILITHPHGDHLNLETLNALDTQNSTFIVPQSVADQMPEKFHKQLKILANGEATSYEDISVLAVPMYNLPEEDARHAKGWGNGYVISMAGKSIYISGDTEDIPEMRALQGINIAFVCMNLPYTMDIKQAASTVLDFEPEIMYPYHHRGQDIREFKALVDAGQKPIEVRLKDWYPEQ